jgi:hypothetical protein
MKCALRCKTPILAAVCLAALGRTALADQWSPAQRKEYASENGQFIFRVTPSPVWSAPGHCKGEPFRILGGKRARAWSRDLINNEAPVRAYVTNSGHHVVTMDEWGQVGRFPVVVYGHNGELVAVHSTESLGLGQDGQHIVKSVSSYWWNANALVFFEPREEVLCIRLHWGKMLLIKLIDGEVMSHEWYEHRRDWDPDARRWPELMKYAARHSGELATKMLVSKEPEERQTAAIVAGRLQLREAIPALNALLSDEAFYWSSKSARFFWGMGRCYYVREAATEALEQMGVKVSASRPASAPATQSSLAR